MTEQDIYSVFDSDGLLSSNLENYEYREDQLSMALNVFSCFENNETWAVEAGTGTGKSYAYLVPAMLDAFEDKDRRTVIATSTINLQQQLLEKDIPVLFDLFGKKCNVTLAVGRNNYLCLRRLNEELSSVPLLAGSGISEYQGIQEFASETETGLRTELKGKPDPQLWSRVCSESDLCMGNKCPFFSDCFYFKAKKNLSNASIIICNHHLLFTDSATRLEGNIDYSEDCILPPFSHLIIDEAHNIERHATDLFTVEYSSRVLRRQLDMIYDSKWHKGRGVRLLDQLVPYCPDKDLYSAIVSDIALLTSDSETLNSAMLSFMEVNRLSHLLLSQTNAPKILNNVRPLALNLIENSKRLVGQITDFSAKLQLSEEDEHRRDDLTVHTARISLITDCLKEFVNWIEWDSDIRYLEVNNVRDIKTVSFMKAPLDVAPVLRDALFSKIDSVVCTSATMDLKDNFGYFCRSVGLPAPNKSFRGKVYDSPFDYKNRLMLLTPYDAADYNKDREDEYAEYLCTNIYNAVSSSGGGALVLFTGYHLMESVYANLKPMLDRLGINSMLQGEASRFDLLTRFREDRDSVLFATSSFWEGVDAPGDTLRLVIITKLPFKMPDEPIFKARSQALEKEGKSSFFFLSLPDATLRLKQGFGRLMRHTRDRGIVLILDSRVVSKQYGALMLSSLPESYHPETTVENVPSKIENFLY